LRGERGGSLVHRKNYEKERSVMESFKIDNFRECHKAEFPPFETLKKEECARLALLLRKKLGHPPDSDSLDFVKHVFSQSQYVNGYNADSEDFSIARLARELDIDVSNEIYVNWRRFDEIDRFRFSDFEKYFSDIWYPGPDDIDVFDDSFKWIISVTHSGKVKCLKINGTSGDDEPDN